jgi:L-amino acid N-acyltransferase YncA
MISFVTEQAMNAGLRQIIAYMRTDNAPIISIFEALGWKLVGAMPRFTDDEPECLFYALALPRPT